MYLLSKAMGGPLVPVLEHDYSLLRELECIADADARARQRAQQRADKASRRKPGRRRR